MTVLVLDIGNTCVTLGRYDHSGVRTAVWRLDTRPVRSGAEYGRELLALWNAAPPPERVAICSVVPEATRQWQSFFHEAWGITAHTLSPTQHALLPLDVEEPEQLGADRLMAAWYAVQKHGCPLLVVDCGTAITVELVSAEGVYQGGIILPGPRLAAQALQLGTAQLPLVPVSKPSSLVGRSTIGCIQSGLYYGWYHLLCGLVAQFRAEVGQNCQVVATGGVVALWESEPAWYDVWEDHLLLDGIFSWSCSLL